MYACIFPIRAPPKVPWLRRFWPTPPAVIVTAQYDPLRDDSLTFAAKLKAAGAPVTVRCWDGAIHGMFGLANFTGLPRRIFLQTVADLEAMLDPTAP